MFGGVFLNSDDLDWDSSFYRIINCFIIILFLLSVFLPEVASSTHVLWPFQKENTSRQVDYA